MNSQIKMRQYVTFIKPQNFDATDIKCLQYLESNFKTNFKIMI